MIPGILDSALQQGLLYAVAVFGVVISFRMMNFPDLTVDGSFTLGGAVMAKMLVAHHPWAIALPVSMMAGFCAGAATAILNRKLGISKILSGILIMLILYSVNLRVMGKANISLLRVDTLFTPFDGNGPGDLLKLGVFGVIASIFFVVLIYIAMTRIGLFLRATGDNEFMVMMQGKNTDWIFIAGIGLANAFVAASGALVVQNQGFADINMGIGLIITALAALIIGESALSTLASLVALVKSSIMRTAAMARVILLPWETFKEIAAALVGAFLYFLIIAFCLRLGLAPTDVKLATGILVILGIAFRFKGPMVETYVRGKF
jgi:putative ABC transport system permease protein